jgi:hypothetical protein
MAIRCRVLNFNQLKLGDHISFPTCINVGEHHAIVVGIVCLFSTWHVSIIDFATQNGLSGDLSKQGCVIRCSVQEHSVDLVEHIRSGKLWCHIYPEGMCSDSTTVIARARNFIGSYFPYNLLTNNCEHFATLCKTGVATSTQIDNCLYVSMFALDLILIFVICALLIFIIISKPMLLGRHAIAVGHYNKIHYSQ